MTVQQFYTNPSFKYGKVDDQYLFRTDTPELFRASCRKLKNWDILASGAVKRRGSRIARVLGGAYGGGDVIMVPYRRQANTLGTTLNEFALAVYNEGGDFKAFFYNLGTGATGSFTIYSGQADLPKLRWAQVGNSLFFCSGIASGFPVIRLDNVNQLATEVGFWFEVSGLWDGAAGASVLNAGLNQPARARDEVGINNQQVAGPGRVELLMAAPGQSGLDGPWRAVDESGTTVNDIINLEAGQLLPISFIGARLWARSLDSSNVPKDHIYSNAITFSRGRLILGGIADILNPIRPTALDARGYGFYEGNRILMSGVGAPFLVRPALDRVSDASPLDFQLIANGAAVINWIAQSETAIYIGCTGSLIVVPSAPNQTSLGNLQDMRTVDNLSVGNVNPIIWRNGVIYVSTNGDKLTWLQFSFQTGGQRSAHINAFQPSIISSVNSIAIIEASGAADSVRRILAANNTETVAVAFDDGGDVLGWSEYEFSYPVKSVLGMNDRAFVACNRGGALDILEIVNDNEYVGDYQSTPIYTSSKWQTNIGAINSMVAVTGVTGGRRLYLGTFRTDGSGFITTPDYENPEVPTTEFPQFTGYSSLIAYVVFDSTLVPFPAVGQDQKGLSVGRKNRVVSIRPFVVNTRQLVVNNEPLFDALNVVSAGQIDLPKVTGWGEKGKLGHYVFSDDEIKGFAIYQAIVAGLSREVAT